MTIKAKYLVLCVSVLLISCGSETDDTSGGTYDPLDAPEWETVRVVEIGDSEELMMQQPLSVFPLQDDHFMVSDFRANRVYVFSGEGDLHGSFLREGRGPGEVQMMNPIISMNEDGQVLIFSQMLRRFSLYRWEEESLNPKKDFTIEMFPRRFHLMPDGSIALIERTRMNMEAEDRIDYLHLIDSEGHMIEEEHMNFPVIEQMVINNPDGLPMMTFASPHHPELMTAFHDDYLFTLRRDEVGFSRYRISTGELVNEVSLHRPDRPVTREEKVEFVDELSDPFDLPAEQRNRLISEIPDIRGKSEGILYDPAGYVWVKLYDDEDPDWIIFSEDGKLEGVLSQPFEGMISSVNNYRMYGISSDEDELPLIMVYDAKR